MSGCPAYINLVIQRTAALILLYSFALFTAEMGVADACGGNATAAQVSSSNAVPLEAVTDASESDRAPASAPTHLGVHVCHCVHAHGGVTPGSVVAGPARAALRLAIAVNYLAPLPLSFPPQLRPPIS